MPRTLEPTLEARARILRAAESLFAAKGYAATSVHEITDAAEVNRALLYYYFEDKHSLYATLIDEGVAEFGTMLETALSRPGTYAERLGAVVRGHLEMIRRRPQMCRMVHRCLLDGYQEEFGLVQKFRGNVERLEQFFREAAAVGEFRTVDPEIAARTFLGPSFVVSMWQIHEGERFDLDVLSDQIIGQLLHGYRAA